MDLYSSFNTARPFTHLRLQEQCFGFRVFPLIVWLKDRPLYWLRFLETSLKYITRNTTSANQWSWGQRPYLSKRSSFYPILSFVWSCHNCYTNYWVMLLLWHHSDLWPPTSDQFKLEPKWMFVSNLQTYGRTTGKCNCQHRGIKTRFPFWSLRGTHRWRRAGTAAGNSAGAVSPGRNLPVRWCTGRWNRSRCRPRTTRTAPARWRRPPASRRSTAPPRPAAAGSARRWPREAACRSAAGGRRARRPEGAWSSGRRR